MRALALLLLVACVPQPQPVERKWGPADARAALEELRSFSSYDPKAPVDPWVLCPRRGLCEDVKPGEICMCTDPRVMCRLDANTCCGYCDGQ